jgi:hypothetical protein
VGRLALSGEAAHVQVDVPAPLSGLFASRQGGFYLQAAAPVLRFDLLSLPGIPLAVAARIDGVDFDRDLPGDSRRSLTVGFNLRPVPEAVLKVAYVRGDVRDRFDNLGRFARVELGLASYF